MKKLPAVFSALLVLIFAVGCSQETSPYFYAMNAEAALYINDKALTGKRGEYNALLKDTGAILNDLDSSLSATNGYSSVCKFNDAEPGATVELDENAYKVLSLAMNMYDLTDGYYNPSVFYSVRAFGFNTDADFPEKSDELPLEEEVGAYRTLSGHFGEITLWEENGRYYAKKPSFSVDYASRTLSLKIDLGGIGKGYAVDAVDALFGKYGFDYGYFDFGASSFSCRKSYVNGDGKYIMAFTDPRAAFAQYGSIKVSDCRLSTSGDYEQYYIIDGERYCHIIDPTTGRPVQTGIMTVTVIGGSAAEDDALTTAIMAMGRERAAKFIVENLDDRKVVFTYDNGGSYEVISNIPLEDFINFSENYSYVDVNQIAEQDDVA